MSWSVIRKGFISRMAEKSFRIVYLLGVIAMLVALQCACASPQKSASEPRPSFYEKPPSEVATLPLEGCKQQPPKPLLVAVEHESQSVRVIINPWAGECWLMTCTGLQPIQDGQCKEFITHWATGRLDDVMPGWKERLE